MPTWKTGDELELNGYIWGPERAAVTIALLHGYGEHAGRYAHVASAWAEAGISTLAIDLRGHGKSPGPRGHVDRFDDYHLDATALVDAARQRAQGKPVFLFGHSMGGLLALHWLMAGCGKDLRGLALSSPYLGLALEVPKLKEAAGRTMSRIYPKLALATNIKGSDVSRDPQMAQRYEEDPLNNKNATARWFTESNLAIERVHARAHELRLPTILLYAGADSVASADATDRFAAQLPGSDKTVERLAGYHHELLNEPLEYRTPVIERYRAWFLTHAEGAA